jgi:hypothetical protein
MEKNRARSKRDTVTGPRERRRRDLLHLTRATTIMYNLVGIAAFIYDTFRR